MRGAEGARREAAGRRRAAAGARDPRHLHGLGAVERGQQTGQPGAAQRLARSGRADDQQAVSPGRGDLQRTPQARLAPQIGEIGGATVAVRRPGRLPAGQRRQLPPRQRPQLAERAQRKDVQRLDERRFGRVARRHGNSLCLPSTGLLRHRQHARNRPNGAVQPQLTGEPDSRQERSGELAGRDEHGRRDREVEPRTRLAKVGRRQAGRDPPQRELESGVGDRRPHALARLAHRGIRKADERERGQPAAHVDLGADAPCRDTVEGEGTGDREHRRSLATDSAHVARRTLRLRHLVRAMGVRAAPTFEP